MASSFRNQRALTSLANRTVVALDLGWRLPPNQETTLLLRRLRSGRDFDRCSEVEDWCRLGCGSLLYSAMMVLAVGGLP